MFSHIQLFGTPLYCSMPGLPVIHYLSEFAQTCIHWVGDAIQPSHPLLPSSLPALNLSKNRIFPMSRLFTSGGQSTGTSASVPSMNIQDWFSLELTGLTLLQEESLESSPTPQFKSINSLVLSLFNGPALTSIHDYRKNHSFDYMDVYLAKWHFMLFNMLSRLVITFLPRSK